MPKFTVNRADGSTYEIKWPPEFHNEPYNEVSIQCEDPEALVASLIAKYEAIRADAHQDLINFPGDTNFVGNAISSVQESLDSLLYFLKMIEYRKENGAL
jgi:hypothetical protein